MKTHSENHSLWQEHPLSILPPLTTNSHTDVCIVGAGISGLSIAYYLLKKGKKVIVLDKHPTLGGETALTSAHISNALDDYYHHIESIRGKETTILAAESHFKAISEIEKIIKDENISCEFKWVDGYLFLGKNNDLSFLDKELQACKDASLKNVEIIKDAHNLNLGPSLKFPKQAQFHSMKYLEGLRKSILKMGGEIYGSAQVVKTIEADIPVVETKNGIFVSCKDLVFATNSPSNNLMATHTKESAYRSYVIGLKIPKNSFPEILWWDSESPYHYVRIEKYKGHDVLIVGGEDHRVGQELNNGSPFVSLQRWAEKTFHLSGEIEFHWSGQIIETLDGLAYIGKSATGSEHIYEVSGDSGHGITHGTIAGMLISDLILEIKNKWEPVYSPSRLNLSTVGTFFKENAQGIIQTVDWLTPGEVNSDKDVKNGEGCIVRRGLTKVAVSRDEKGILHECSATCPHLGAIVRWNHTEKTWDCPLHGSRFSPDGEVLNGPAISDLKKVDPEKD